MAVMWKAHGLRQKLFDFCECTQPMWVKTEMCKMLFEPKIFTRTAKEILNVVMFRQHQKNQLPKKAFSVRNLEKRSALCPYLSGIQRKPWVQIEKSNLQTYASAYTCMMCIIRQSVVSTFMYICNFTKSSQKWWYPVMVGLSVVVCLSVHGWVRPSH